MGDYSFKRIADPVHGSIGISAVEAAILKSKSFLRLRNISQLGLASYVYPSANYSRFAHSLGVCHITGKLLSSLSRSTKLDDHEVQQYRLAGLLHDIGHYPFSHAMEIAIKNYSNSSLFVRGTGGDGIQSYLSHEALGARVLEKANDIRAILKEYDFEPYDIYRIFNREAPPKLANLVSSDLDADRIDYMLRTSSHTGLPYGSVDVEYLISQLTLDDENFVCVTKKALRTAEHFLLCRYFDYQQVYFHKTVVGIELVLKDVLQEMLKLDIIACNEDEIMRRISSGNWANFDEIYIISLMREILASPYSYEKNLITKIESVLFRTPPCLLLAEDFFSTNDETSNKQFRRNVKTINSIKEQISKEFGIDPSMLYVWDMDTGFTKVPAQVSQQKLMDGKQDTDKVMQSIFVKYDDGKRRPLMNCSESLMQMLANAKLFTCRLYLLLDKQNASLREKITARARELYN